MALVAKPICTPLGANRKSAGLITSRTGCDHRDAWVTKNNLILQNYRSYYGESIKGRAEVSRVDKIQKT
jgi:hypothetical protein